MTTPVDPILMRVEIRIRTYPHTSCWATAVLGMLMGYYIGSR
jgi:hypothetical protein